MATFPKSLQARILILKMDSQPRVNFFASMLPITPPSNYGNKLHSLITSHETHSGTLIWIHKVKQCDPSYTQCFLYFKALYIERVGAKHHEHMMGSAPLDWD